MTKILKLAVIGSGLKAAEYASSWVRMEDVQFVAIADTVAASRQRLSAICAADGRAAPLEFADYRDMLDAVAGQVDAVYISTPHAFHAEQALAATEKGLDILLEKPMVTTVDEARALVEAQKKARNTIVIAFQGGLSPLVLDTRKRAGAGEFGELVSVAATIWEGWSEAYNNHWKQDPAISGGGFMFDTGAHMMNTVCLLADSDFDRVSAYMNTLGKPVDIVTAVSARLKSGALATFTATGKGPPGCASYMTLFYTKAIVRIDAWGAWREISAEGKPGERELSELLDNPIKTFIAIRSGLMHNPCTVENGLRFARLWDGIKLSAAQDGMPVAVDAIGAAP